MGREIRRVPPHWEHPRYTKENAGRDDFIGRFMPLIDKDYESACREWYQEAAEFKPTKFSKWYHEYAGNPPDEEFYRPKWEVEPTWWQVYETVSEGTPVTPPFATSEELIEFLCTKKDFLNQGPRTRESATAFVKDGWAPSMAIINGKIYENMDVAVAPH